MSINQFLLDLLYVIITSVVPFLVYYLIKVLTAKFDQIKVVTKDSALDHSVQFILDTILAVVSSTTQTYVESLKKSGKFDEEAQKIAFNKSKENIMKLLSSESKQLIVTLYNDLDTWLDVQIENTILRSK